MNKIQAVLFDLDGVILSTDDLHYQAWKAIADEEGIFFDRAINERLRGVSRMESLAIILERAEKTCTAEEKEQLAESKNNIYKELLKTLTPADIYAGIAEMLEMLRGRGINCAIGSSSKNAKPILKQIGMFDFFDGAISDGTNIVNSKPDPEVFIQAAEMVNTPNENCLVVEDAEAGLEAAKRGGMPAAGVGSAAGHALADFSADTAADLDWDRILGV